MEQILKQVRKNKKGWKFVVLGYIAFIGCFVFPIVFNKDLLEFTYLYPLVVSVIMIGIILVGVIDKQPSKVYFYSLTFSGIGMILRYILEYGEVSNTKNFTPINVGVYLLIVPTLIIGINNLLWEVGNIHEYK